mmetsp:Transcript_27402/g.49324  ORF Transcript_27402/g.49324 Transcript_27402/m.49324 type:complete len:205 (-) Transcript_27402:3156-3770(-)
MKSLFSFVNSVVGGDEEVKTPSKPLILPWDDYEAKAKELGVKGNVSELLKEKILEIADDEDALLDDVEFEFDFDSRVGVIMELLNLDATLKDAFRRLVPNKTTEEKFWKSYFYQVEAVKEATLKRYAAKPQVKQPVKTDEDILAELESELTDDKPIIMKKKKPSVSLETQLKDALQRISALEATVKRLEAKVDELTVDKANTPA